jgi:hypothetical protein
VAEAARYYIWCDGKTVHRVYQGRNFTLSGRKIAKNRQKSGAYPHLTRESGVLQTKKPKKTAGIVDALSLRCDLGLLFGDFTARSRNLCSGSQMQATGMGSL